MAFKVFLLALLAVTAVSCNQAVKFGFPVEENFGVIDIIQKIAETIKTAVDQALKEINQHIFEIIEVIRNELTKAEEVVNKIISEALEEIRKLEEELKEATDDAKECIREAAKQVAVLAKAHREANLKCVEEIIARLRELKADAKKELLAASAQVKELGQEFLDCADWDCKKEVIKKAVQLVKDTRAAIRKLAVAAHEDIKAQAPAAVECLKKNREELRAGLQQVAADLRTCIKQ